MKKKYDFLFIGPQASGKTTICKQLEGGQPPHEYEETNNKSNKTFKIKGTGFLGIGQDVAIDTGGMPSQEDFYKQWILNSQKVIFVFNGLEFLEELKNYKRGGETSMKIYQSVLEKTYHKEGLNTSNLFFVATHNDVFEQRFPNQDMKQEIYKSLRIANDEYRKIAHIDRYKFMGELQGRLFVINALDNNNVKNVFQDIKKERI